MVEIVVAVVALVSACIFLAHAIEAYRRLKSADRSSAPQHRKPAGGDLRVTTPAGQLMSKHVTAVECRDTPFEAGLR